MVNANVELAFGELAGFELASGLGTNVVLSAFAVSAVAVATLVGGAFANGQAQAAAVTTTSLTAAGVNQTGLSGSGVASLSWNSGLISQPVFGFVGTSNITFVGGMALSGVMGAVGESFTDLKSFVDPGFDVSGTSSVVFYSETPKNTVFGAVGVGIADFGSQPIVATRLGATGTSSVVLPTVSYQMSGLSIASSSLVTLGGYRVQAASMQSLAQTAVTLLAQAVTATQTNPTGQATVTFGSVYANTTALVANANSTFNLPTQTIQLAGLQSASLGSLAWKPGRAIYASLPAAKDGVQRPFELRSIAHPPEQRTTQWV